MNTKKSYIPVKVFISYLVLIGLVVAVGWVLYSENKVFSETEQKMAAENYKMLKVGNLLSDISKTESLARITIQSNSRNEFNAFVCKIDTLQIKIDSIKILIDNPYQNTLLDSVKELLSKKTTNIAQLKSIKNLASDAIAVKKALNNIGEMEGDLRKLRIEDLVKNPSELEPYQKRVWLKYVDYINQNIPNDSTNTLSQKTLDSMLVASKKALGTVVRETYKQKIALNSQENKLLQNELLISEQLRKILIIIENEITTSTAKNNTLKQVALKKTNKIISYAAVVGFLLTLFFSIIILTDFSKSQTYKKQLEIANNKAENLLKNREQLISTVSHDLKTPLSTIIGYVELLSNAELTKKQSYFIDNIKGSAGYISKLVQDLLDFTQIEAGKISIESIPFSLYDLIHEVAKSVQSVHQRKPIALQIEIDKNLEQKILGDPFRLRQILTNIIGNAFKFTEKGFIKIAANAQIENHIFQITIEDSGIGIKKENSNLVFEEFTQADSSIEKKYGGTGLGLTISKKMAALLGGEIKMESKYGKGSVFEILLPFRLDTSPLNATFLLKNNRQLTAIVIDDDDNLLQLTAEILKQKNYHVVPFNNAKTAIEIIKTTHFDLIITDIQMPEMDGFLLMETLKNATETLYKNQPVIALTGNSEFNNEMFKKAGFAGFIRKPYAPNELFAMLDQLFENQIIANNNRVTINKTGFASAYDLTSLRSFLPDNDEALKKVLLSFETTTKENIVHLATAIKQNNTLAIKEIAHRMGPMFRQIQADAIGKILEHLELKEISEAEYAIVLDELKQKINALFLVLRKDSIL